MTDNEIIKALECCAADINCKECSMDLKPNCFSKLNKDALDLINRQKAKNESLKVDLAKCSIRLDNLYKTADEIKSEAIKEFAKELKNCFAISGDYLDIINIIDNLVKEMTEVNENE